MLNKCENLNLDYYFIIAASEGIANKNYFIFMMCHKIKKLSYQMD